MGMGPHQFDVVALNNTSADPRAKFPIGMPAASLDDACRALMQSIALSREDHMGTLVATVGANNACTLVTNEGLIDPSSTVSGGVARISRPFSLRIGFSASPTGMATNAPTLAIDGAAAATLTKSDGSALVDGDIIAGKSYEIIGFTFASGVLTKIRVIGALPSDINALANAAINTVVPPLIAALGTPVQKAGDTMSGNLIISKANPEIQLVYGGVFRWGVMTANNAELQFRNGDDGSVKMALRVDGSLWTQQLGDLNGRIESRASALATQQAQAYTNNCVQSMRFVFAGDLYNSWNIDAQFHSPFGGYACIVDRTTFYEVDGTWNIGLFRWRYLQMYIPNQGWVTVTAAS